MKKALLTCAAVLFSFSLFPVMIQAETDDQASTETTNIEKRYVADSLWLQLRSGPGNEYRILKQLKSGEHLIFLKQTDDKNTPG